jgi:hypothetical protein
MQERRVSAIKARHEATEKKKADDHKAFRKELEAEKKKYLEKCQRTLNFNKNNFRMLNQSLMSSEVF